VRWHRQHNFANRAKAAFPRAYPVEKKKWPLENRLGIMRDWMSSPIRPGSIGHGFIFFCKRISYENQHCILHPLKLPTTRFQAGGGITEHCRRGSRTDAGRQRYFRRNCRRQKNLFQDGDGTFSGRWGDRQTDPAGLIEAAGSTSRCWMCARQAGQLTLMFSLAQCDLKPLIKPTPPRGQKLMNSVK